MKKTITYIIIIALLLLPAIVGVKSYFDAQNAPASAKNALSIKIDDISGNTYVIDREKKPEILAETVDFCLGLNSKATKIMALPDSVTGQKCFKVTISTAIKEEVYQYYMSTSPELCYMVDPKGAAYHLAESDAVKFLDSPFAESLYTGAKRPTITVSNEFTPAPVSAVWKYKTHSANYVTADTDAILATEDQYLDINGSIAVTFDVVPDHCQVKIIDSAGITLHDDSADSLANLMIDEETKVNVEITAKWYEESERDYHGEYTYKFGATLRAPASFYVMKTEVEKGKFTALSAKRVADISKITYTCEPDLGVTPVFYAEGEYAHALLPVPYDAEPGAYKITLSYGSTVQEISLNVTETARQDSTITISDAVLSQSYTEAALAEFDTLVETVTATTSEKRLFDGYFLSQPGDMNITCGYGRNVLINSDPSNTYLNTGVDYRPFEGSDVLAPNAGVVAYVGNTAYTGNVVVIDHGMGLKTWYWGLSAVSVEKDASVSRETPIGKSGTTGFCDDTAGFHTAMTVGNVFVCPYDTWINGDGGIYMQGVLEPAAKN
ncbi:MAG: M23 family metallopeptidase [Clostridia bacterium]|nr:M23 family metallopeptidase [Clostridia bacterium]